MSTMITLDTNILVEAYSEHEPDHMYVVSTVVQVGTLCIDTEGQILREYERNLGTAPGYRKAYQRLVQRQAIHYCSSHLSTRHVSKLRASQCHEPSDHIFIGVAYNSGRILVSEDSDVGKGPKGHESPHCDALKYLTVDMGLKVLDAREFSALAASMR